MAKCDFIHLSNLNIHYDLALRTFPNSTSGRFFCQVSAQQSALPAPRPVTPGGWVTGPSFPQRPSYVSSPAQGPIAIYRPQQSPAYQSGFQPSQTYPPYTPQQSGYPQQPYYSRPVPAPQPPPQPVQSTPTIQPARPAPSPVYAPSWQPSYSPSYAPSYQPGYPTYQPAQPAQPVQASPPAPQPVYGGYVGGYQNGYQIYPAQQGFPGYTPTQQVYQPMGPQDQGQCQVQCGLRKRVHFLD